MDAAREELPAHTDGLAPAARDAAGRNFALLAANQAIFRIGWVFKTESVIIPAFLDAIAGAGWIRGFLPVLNRAGQSLPVFLLSSRLEATPQKKRPLFGAHVVQSAIFAVLAFGVAFSGGPGPSWMPAAFLLLYAAFFSAGGLSNVLLGTMQGKLVAVDRRGRLVATATFGGAVPAVVLAWWLLPGWLEAPGGADFASIFGFTAVVFALSALVLPLLREPPDANVGVVGRHRVREQIDDAVRILRDNRDFRRLVYVGALFNTMILVAPHYQALGREALGLAGENLMLWVVAQHLSMGVTSLVAGPLADRYGNRLALRLVSLATAAVPLLAIGIARLDPETGRRLFPLVFVGLGLTPIGFRILANYTLEIAPRAEHPRYLATSQLCFAVGFVLSPAIGLLIDVTSFEVVFIGIALLIATAGLMTFALVEPRHASTPRRTV